MATSANSHAAGDEGSMLVEIAVTLPVLFGLIFGFIAICLTFYSYEMISEAAREGTRYAMVRGASCPTTANPTCEATVAQVNAYVSGLGLPNLGGGSVVPNAMYPDGNENVGSHVTVTVTYVVHLTLPFVPARPLTLSSTSMATILQ